VTPPRQTRRRLALALLSLFAVFSIFVVRLVDIQLVRADELNTDSTNKRAIGVTTYAARGDIVDKDGSVLAGSVMRFDITVSPRTVIEAYRDAEAETLLDAAAGIAAITGQTTDEVMRAVMADPESDFAYIAKAVTTEQMRQIRALEIPGVIPSQHPIRIYPGGSVAGNLVGFVGTDGPQNGLEYTENDCLASTNGTSTYERGADGIRLPGSTVTTQPAVEGGTITTTIDSDLNWSVQQMIAEQGLAIGASSALAMVTEVSTGKLLTVADWPSVDPNNRDATPPEYLGSLAFSAAYEPGSIFKPMTASMLLDQGVASPTTQVTVPSRWTSPEGSVIKDAAAHAEQRLTLAGVIQQSSNVGISQLATRLPSGMRYDYMTAFGVGERTEVDFQGESKGLLASRWDDQQKYDVAYGQGVSTSLAQVSSIYQTLGNGGVRMPLTLVSSCTGPDGIVVDPAPVEGARVVSEAAADTTVQMMEGVVTGGGLARELQIPGYRVAAKSGTAEVSENGRYTSKRVVSIAGLAPAEDPKYAVVVMFVNPGTMKTSAAAAPTFKKIMTKVLTTYRVTPSTTPPPALPTTW
jgi:cell division protein FtsI (penicillin-binding protein 3)